MYYAKYFAEKGFNIVSGLALGCDTIAHKGALSVNGTTTAILAHGLQMISPKRNEFIAKEILEKGGLLLSEYLFGVPAYNTSFVERDRLQAGLAIATIVIQTGIKGGTMHAVRTTINNNKILAVVNYKEQSVKCNENVAGNELLISRGSFSLRKAEVLFEFLQQGGVLNYQNDELRIF
jgi:DNA processing protein